MTMIQPDYVHQPIYFKMFKELHGINNLNMHLLEGHFQFTPPPVFFPIFGLRVSEIGNRYPGFSGMLIPNMTSVLQYEVLGYVYSFVA